MINIKEIPLSKKLGKTRRSTILNRGRREIIHHSLEIFLKDSHLLGILEGLIQGRKSQGNHLFNVGVVREIISIDIVLTKVKK
jgi:hypothetical protein